MPPAARIGDFHICPLVPPSDKTPPALLPIVEGFPTVIIGFQMAARMNDETVCISGSGSILAGSPTVFIDRKMAARVLDPCSTGGIILTGCPTVNIGTTPQIQTMLAAAKLGVPFCEVCEPGNVSDPVDGFDGSDLPPPSTTASTSTTTEGT